MGADLRRCGRASREYHINVDGGQVCSASVGLLITGEIIFVHLQNIHSFISNCCGGERERRCRNNITNYAVKKVNHTETVQAVNISLGIFPRNHTNRYTPNDVLEAANVADVYMRCLHLNLQVKDVQAASALIVPNSEHIAIAIRFIHSFVCARQIAKHSLE